MKTEAKKDVPVPLEYVKQFQEWGPLYWYRVLGVEPSEAALAEFAKWTMKKKR